MKDSTFLELINEFNADLKKAKSLLNENKIFDHGSVNGFYDEVSQLEKEREIIATFFAQRATRLKNRVKRYLEERNPNEPTKDRAED